ncbi:MAG: glycosyl transferase [Planctomycetaceae bacterium]|nr:glycosyl transferase [Planctomycetaceae bacterium]
MIPKVIHYCWFGGNSLPPLAVKCIESWEKFCPDYEIKEWNESNFDLKISPYVKEAYEAKKWAFVSDYARLWVLVNFGGIYLDTDCELVKPIDGFLNLEAMSGFESETYIPTGIMGCRKGFPLFVELLKRYNDRHFIKPDGSFDMTTNTQDITRACLDHGFVPNNEKQTICGFTLFPRDWFCPMDGRTQKMVAFTENTHAIHHFAASWKTPETKMKTIIKFPERFIRRWIVKPIKKQLKTA